MRQTLPITPLGSSKVGPHALTGQSITSKWWARIRSVLHSPMRGSNATNDVTVFTSDIVIFIMSVATISLSILAVEEEQPRPLNTTISSTITVDRMTFTPKGFKLHHLS